MAGVWLAFHAPVIAGFPQVPGQPGAPTPLSNFRVVVRGSKNPELLTDRTAIHGLVLSWSSAVARPDRAFDAMTSRLALSGSDLKIVRTHMQRAHEALEEVQAQSRSNPSVRSAALEQIFAITAEAYERLLDSVSKGGVRAIREHVEYRKTRTSAFGVSFEPISELTALRLLLARVGEPRPEPVFTRLKLGAADSALLLSEARRFKETMQEVMARHKTAPPPQPESREQWLSALATMEQASAEVHTEARVVLAAVLERLGTQLTKDGNKKLRSYLTELRKNLEEA